MPQVFSILLANGYINIKLCVSEDGEMNEMTLHSRHRIRNSSPDGLRTSTLPLGPRDSPQCQIFTSERGRNFLFLR